MGARSIETVLVRSLHPHFAPVGQERYVTPEEAKILIMIGRAEPVIAQHREMVAGERGAKHREVLIRDRKKGG